MWPHVRVPKSWPVLRFTPQAIKSHVDQRPQKLPESKNKPTRLVVAHLVVGSPPILVAHLVEAHPAGSRRWGGTEAQLLH